MTTLFHGCRLELRDSIAEIGLLESIYGDGIFVGTRAVAERHAMRSAQFHGDPAGLIVIVDVPGGIEILPDPDVGRGAFKLRCSHLPVSTIAGFLTVAVRTPHQVKTYVAGGARSNPLLNALFGFYQGWAVASAALREPEQPEKPKGIPQKPL